MRGEDRYTLGDVIDFQPSETATITGPAGTAFKYRNSAESRPDRSARHLPFRDGESTHRFAVNLDESESHTEPLGEDAMERFDVILGKNVTTEQAKENQRQLRDRELENRQRIWQWLLVTALGLLGLETFLGARWSRRRIGAEGEQLAGAGVIHCRSLVPTEILSLGCPNRDIVARLSQPRYCGSVVPTEFGERLVWDKRATINEHGLIL